MSEDDFEETNFEIEMSKKLKRKQEIDEEEFEDDEFEDLEEQVMDQQVINKQKKQRKDHSNDISKKKRKIEKKKESEFQVVNWKEFSKNDPTLKQIQKMVNELKKTTSSKKKQEILSQYPECSKILLYTYNPFWQFHVTSATCKSVAKRLELRKLAVNVSNIFELLDLLRLGKISGNAALASVNYFITFNRTYIDLIYHIIDRNLQIRMNVPSINKVFPGLIPSFSVALAEKYEEGTIDFSKEEWFSSRKMDGVRVLAFCKSPNDIKFYSRQKNQFTTLGLIEVTLKKLNLSNVILDGEMCEIGSNGLEDFNGIVSKIKRKNGTIQNPRYYVFDILTFDEFDSTTSKRILSERQQQLHSIFENGEGEPYIKVASQIKINKEEQLNEAFNNAVENGWEGLILRKNTIYDGSRSKDLLKVKTYETEEFVVQDLDFSEIRYVIDKKDTLVKAVSHLIILLDGKYTVFVGSGLSKEQRMDWAKDPKLILGKTISVGFGGRSKNKDGSFSLRFPTLKAVYGDKRDM